MCGFVPIFSQSIKRNGIPEIITHARLSFQSDNIAYEGNINTLIDFRPKRVSK